MRDFVYKPMDSKKIYLTKDGLETLRKEYDEMTKKKRPEVLEMLSQARNQGDLSENAEYQAAREELSFIDGRIDELEEMLKQVTLIENAKVGKNGKRKSIELGAKVTLNAAGKKHVYTVVGEWEADPAQQKISDQSPLGKALIGKIVGDKIEVEAPAGKISYTIVTIE
jgi:transcription elongation factor GreA